MVIQELHKAMYGALSTAYPTTRIVDTYQTLTSFPTLVMSDTSVVGSTETKDGWGYQLDATIHVYATATTSYNAVTTLAEGVIAVLQGLTTLGAYKVAESSLLACRKVASGVDGIAHHVITFRFHVVA
jgi:hypothetical protein